MREMQLNGSTIKVVERDFEIGKEAWNEYKLLDGGTIRVKLSAVRICQQMNDDGTPAVDAQGDLVYVVISRNDVVARR